VVSTSASSITSSWAALSVLVPPTITLQPLDQTVGAGWSVKFIVEASGTTPFSYQWKKNNVIISGATSSWLNLQNVAAVDAGLYTVVVTNAGGSTTSTPATLTIDPLPLRIDSQPANAAVVAGQTATFTVVANASLPISYQWYKLTTLLPGATSASLVISNAQATDEGRYHVYVSTSVRSIDSYKATLSLVVPPAFTQQPLDETVSAGMNVTFYVHLSGTTPFSFQWKKSNVNIPGATSRLLQLKTVTAADAGVYTVVVTNAGGTATSIPATLTVQ
jgi:hypothetical protein